MSLLNRRIRGFRLVDLVGLGLLVLIILGVYLAKTVAGGKRAEIAAVERQIKAEKARIRLLEAEVAHLERPGRIERLSVGYLKMEPVPANREAAVEQLIDIARAGPAPKSQAVSAVAAMVNSGAGSKATPGVPPPDPETDIRLAQVAP